MKVGELNKELATIKKNKNSLLLKKLEDLGIDYKVYGMLDDLGYDYFRVRVVIDSDLEDYEYTDIWYDRYDKCFYGVDYKKVIW